MERERTLADESAVSPVIGVVLMFAVTILLAATVAAFFLGFGQQTGTDPPQVAFDFDYEADTTSPAQDVLYIAHDGGDAVETKHVVVLVDDAATDLTGDHDEDYRFASDLGVTEDMVVAGVQANISVRSHNLNHDPDINALSLESARVRVLWKPRDSQRSFVLGEWTGPSS